MLAAFIYILACIGMTLILTCGKIFEKPRDWLGWKFLHCPQCMGFHVGWFMFILFWLGGIQLFPSFTIGLFVFACVSSFVSYFGSMIIDDDGLRINRQE